MSIDLRSKSSAATNAHRVLRITASNLPEQPCLNGQNVTCFFTWCPVSHCPLAMPFVHQGFFNTGPLKNSIKTFVTIKVCSMFLTGRPPRCKSRSPMLKKIRGSQSTESDHCFRKQCFQWGLRIRSRRPSRPVHEVGLLQEPWYGWPYPSLPTRRTDALSILPSDFLRCWRNVIRMTLWSASIEKMPKRW